jgi:uncharacterized protein with gpF-like domain
MRETRDAIKQLDSIFEFVTLSMESSSSLGERVSAKFLKDKLTAIRTDLEILDIKADNLQQLIDGTKSTQTGIDDPFLDFDPDNVVLH